ncbi:ABC transporter permease [Alicyclobacillus pomorum]|uniref:ABC transporter permease n=1 Tax=Alicyclobacillus pomorum TaxID=204470 RepID=UPI00042A093D|nr:ABC transporter permease [Alicyclobacillus pomorum]
MASYIIRRLIGAVVVLFGISIITFIIAYAAPGDPARLIVGAKAPQSVVDAVRHNLGLDQPLPIQYIHYVGRLLQGNLGFSYHNNLPVTELLGQRLGNTVQLALGGWIVELILGIPLGIFGALYHRRIADYILSFLSLVGISMPVFVFGMWLIQNVAHGLGILPLGGAGGISHLILPSITLGVTGMAFYQRLMKSSMVEVMGQDYIRTARAFGVPPRRVITHHAMRNGLLPAVTYAGMDIAQLFGGVVLTETVFNYPGIGQLAWQSIENLDFPVIMATVLLAAVFVVVANFVVDIVYSVIDPRISLS